MSLKKKFDNGFYESQFNVTEDMLHALQSEDWNTLDSLIAKSAAIGGSQGSLRSLLENYLDFNSLEHIIAIRSAPDDEDGIWHDDGSRLVGFSLSLTVNHESISGGELQLRIKGETNAQVITTRPLGTIIVFLTGVYGYEHRVTAVSCGQRIVIAGWCQ